MSSFRSKACCVLSVAALWGLPACGSAGSEPSTSEPEAPSVPTDDGAGPIVGGEAPPTDPGTSTNPADPASAPPSLGPVGEWKWIDVPGAVCGLGQPTGFEVNIGSSNDVLFYLEGGGLCWDEMSCQVDVNGVTIAHHFLNGFTEHTFEAEAKNNPLFDRTRANNPFKNSTIVYVPYCTGDFHAGTTTRWFNIAKTTAHWAGRQNLDLFLAKVVPALPNVSRITLAGSSAGGFGTLINYGHVREAFGNKRVDMITDSAPVFWNSVILSSGMTAWNGAAALPSDCQDCAGNLRKLYSYYAAKYPDARFALTTNDKDAAISTGVYQQLPFQQFTNSVADLTEGTLKPLANFRYFVADGLNHPLMATLDAVSQPMCCQGVNGICILPRACGKAMTLGDWLTKMHSDDPTWANQTSIPVPPTDRIQLPF